MALNDRQVLHKEDFNEKEVKLTKWKQQQMDRERLEEERDLQRKLIFEQLNNPQFQLRFNDEEELERDEANPNENVSIVEEEEEEQALADNAQTDGQRAEMDKAKQVQEAIARIEHTLEDQQEQSPREEQQSAHNTINVIREVALRKQREREQIGFDS